LFCPPKRPYQLLPGGEAAGAWSWSRASI